MSSLAADELGADELAKETHAVAAHQARRLDGSAVALCNFAKQLLRAAVARMRPGLPLEGYRWHEECWQAPPPYTVHGAG